MHSKPCLATLTQGTGDHLLGNFSSPNEMKSCHHHLQMQMLNGQEKGNPRKTGQWWHSSQTPWTRQVHCKRLRLCFQRWGTGLYYRQYTLGCGGTTTFSILHQIYTTLMNAISLFQKMQKLMSVRKKLMPEAISRPFLTLWLPQLNGRVVTCVQQADWL